MPPFAIRNTYRLQARRAPPRNQALTRHRQRQHGSQRWGGSHWILILCSTNKAIPHCKQLMKRRSRDGNPATDPDDSPSTDHTIRLWEYLIVEVNNKGRLGSDKQWFVYFLGPNREASLKIYDDQRREIDAINELGREGWELIDRSAFSTKDDSITGWSYIFKRPRA
jgi:hypothetical protein